LEHGMSIASFRNRFLLILLLLCDTKIINGLHIICDLGGVLIETKYVRTIITIGVEKFAYYASTWQNPFTCHKLLYSFLESIKPHNPDVPFSKDAHGLIMPQLMCDWLKGTISSTELLTLINGHAGSFKSWSQEVLVRALAETIFDPKNFTRTRYLVNSGISFLKTCKKEGHHLYALSNWDPESFDILQNQYPDFFNLFDGVMISGDVGLLKPDPLIYKYFLETFDLDPTECFFIDDQLENITAAQKLGIESMQYRKRRGLFGSYGNFDTILKRIRKANSKLLVPIRNEEGNRKEHQ
jgi:FMN phosphatase YigB (HAD superfamily)